MARKPMTKEQRKLIDGENNRDRFLRVANRRVSGILEGLNTLSKCSNKNIYDYSKEDVDKLEKVIDEALKECIERFKGKKASSPSLNIFE